MDNGQVGQEPQPIDAKVDGVMHEFETSKVGRHIPLEIKDIDCRDLEFVALCAKAMLFVPTAILTFIKTEGVEYWYGLLMRIVAILDMIFGVTMFFLSIKAAFPAYVISVALKTFLILIYMLIVCYNNMSFLVALFSVLFLLMHGAVEMLNLFYLRNTVSKYDEESANKEIAEVVV